MKLIDMKGKRFGRLLVLEQGPPRRPAKFGGSLWRCRCDCGTDKLIVGSSLRNGTIRSCGCLADEWASHMGGNPEFIQKRADGQVQHGHKRRSGGSVEYRTWVGMKRRCSDPKFKDYRYYGGRGIRVCEDWLHSFEAFFAYVGKKPSRAHSIDRYPNNDGNYEPGNVRWATPSQQARNQRRSPRAIAATIQQHT